MTPSSVPPNPLSRILRFFRACGLFPASGSNILHLSRTRWEGGDLIFQRNRNTRVAAFDKIGEHHLLHNSKDPVGISISVRLDMDNSAAVVLCIGNVGVHIELVASYPVDRIICWERVGNCMGKTAGPAWARIVCVIDADENSQWSPSLGYWKRGIYSCLNDCFC